MRTLLRYAAPALGLVVALFFFTTAEWFAVAACVVLVIGLHRMSAIPRVAGWEHRDAAGPFILGTIVASLVLLVAGPVLLGVFLGWPAGVVAGLLCLCYVVLPALEPVRPTSTARYGTATS